MNKVIYTLFLLSCIVIQNKVNAQGELSWSPTQATLIDNPLNPQPQPGTWYIVTPYTQCDGSSQTINWRMRYSFSGPMGGFGPNPYRYTALLYRGNNLIYSGSVDSSVHWNYFIHYNEPLIAGTYSVYIKAEIRRITGWETYSEGIWNKIIMNVNECCPLSKSITGTWTKPLQESGGNIFSYGTTTVPSGSNVKLDATPGSYVLLNDGFEAQGGSVFVAEAYNGCSPGAPARILLNQQVKDNDPVGIKVPEELVVYPNPNNGRITIKHPESVKQIEVYNIVGKLILRVSTAAMETQIDLTNQPAGTYLVKAEGLSVKRLLKY